MRRNFQRIDDNEKIATILKKTRIGRLATTGSDGYPYVTPLNYVYWNGAIYFHCARNGEKLSNIERDNRVCFEVDIPLSYLGTDYDPEKPPCAVSQIYQSVIIRGRGEVVEEISEKVGALNALMATHENAAEFNAISEKMKGVALCLVVAVRIEKISAKENLFQNRSVDDKKKICGYLKKRGLPGDDMASKLIF